MDRTIETYVNGVFGGLRETPQVKEQKDELMADLQAKTEDLVAEGQSADIAPGIAIASFGDLSGLVTEFREQQAAEDEIHIAEEVEKLAGKNVYTPVEYTVYTARFDLAVKLAVALLVVGSLAALVIFFLGVEDSYYGFPGLTILCTYAAAGGAIYLCRTAYRIFKLKPDEVGTVVFDRKADRKRLFKWSLITLIVTFFLMEFFSTMEEFWFWIPLYVVFVGLVLDSGIRKKFLENGTFAVSDEDCPEN